ncbi:RDD family protein [Streptomyces sp. RK75]|uniref:RDD family protein n=1 Tax=Streptomyces sp. RK75 TaxID=2824895 RepID=UPI00160C2D30|nr:RDD family protein [Streptomyces sp. RK75]MBQ0862865.1 RDD family protein [Streptomyces sp. RK75]
MSTEQPENDPFRKRQDPQEPQESEQPRSPGPGQGPQRPGAGGQAPGQEPPGGGSPPPGGPGMPYGDPPPPPTGGGPAGGPGGGYGGGYGSPYDNPYGGPAGAADPLAGMAPLASRGRRLLARIIDALLIAIPIGIIAGVVEGGYSTDTGISYWPQLGYTLAYFLYEGLMLTNSGQTVGKRLMRIRVAMLQNGAVPAGSPGWLRVAVYQIPPLVPCVGSLFWLVNVLFCTWDKPYQQCLHDKAARTVVVAAD